MKIGLNIGGSDPKDSKAAEQRALENLILNAKKGDWEAKDQLVLKFKPLLTSLAEKRTEDTEMINKYTEAGKEGLLAAASKYKTTVGPEHFRIFALDFIETNMDHAEKGGGILSRLFGKK